MNMTKDSATRTTLSPSDQTREALIHAALDLFGRKGFDATSTREIAARARANIGSIAYHFGSKEGLRDACARHVVDTIRRVAGPALADETPLPQAGDAEAMITTVAERMMGFIVARPEAGAFVQFILREITQPTTALDILYSGVFEPLHRRMCALWEQATGEPAESERTRITIFTLIGQVVYFRIARDAVLRRMGWDSIGPEEAKAISGVAIENIEAALRARKGALKEGGR